MLKELVCQGRTKEYEHLRPKRWLKIRPHSFYWAGALGRTYKKKHSGIRVNVGQ